MSFQYVIGCIVIARQGISDDEDEDGWVALAEAPPELKVGACCYLVVCFSS